MSGIQFNSAVSNRLATPAIMAQNSDEFGFPNTASVGTLFIDTYNPSGGIFRFDGSGWLQIALGTAGGGTPTLQAVTNVGNFTYNPIQFNYSDSYGSNAIYFYNDLSGATEYEITKCNNGVGANDILSIASSVGGSNTVGIAIDKNYLTITTYKGYFQNYGLRCDLASRFFSLGDWAGGFGSTFLTVNDAAGYVEFSTNQRFATAGGSSGQHLRIRIGSTFYKIALLNN